METIDMPFFGKITLDRNINEQQFQKYVTINDTLVDFNLIYETEEVTMADLFLVQSFLADFEKHAAKATGAILKNYEKNGDSKDFIRTHLDALTPLGKEILKETFSKDLPLDKYFLKELALTFVYIFPEDPNEFIKLNYQVSEEFTDEYLFVRFGKDSSIKEIGIEY